MPLEKQVFRHYIGHLFGRLLHSKPLCELYLSLCQKIHAFPVVALVKDVLALVQISRLEHMGQAIQDGSFIDAYNNLSMKVVIYQRHIAYVA